MQPTPRATFRIVKGSPLTVLIALMHLGGEAGVMDICDLTTYTDKTVNRALEALADAGLVTNTHRYQGWILTQHGKQIPFFLVGRDAPGVGDFSRVGEIPATTAVKDLNTKSLINSKQAVGVDSPEISPARLEALKSASVGEPVRSELAADDSLSPEYIRGMAAMTASEKLGVGMLVHRLRSHDHLPDKWLSLCSSCGKKPATHQGECEPCHWNGFVNR